MNLEAWRSQGILVPVVTKVSEHSANGEAAERIWSQHDRVLRAVKTFMIWFIVASAALFVPIVHFVLVPILMLICIVATVSAYRQQKQILGGCAICPVCKSEFEIISGYSEWPLQSNCTHCHRIVTISKQA